MANAAFRGVLASNIMASIALGTSRFVFVWLVGELTEWNPATAILGIVIGLPPLLLSAWAGSLADRISARALGVALFTASTALFTISAVLLHAGLMTVPVAMVCGLVTAIAPAMLMPLLQALVPRVVDDSALLQAVALQNLGMTGSSVGGIFLGGAVIQAFGLEAGLWLLTAASLGGVIIHRRTPIPPHKASTARQGAIRSAAAIAFRTEPLRALLALTTVLGIVITASTLLLPEIARDVLGKQSLAASALNVAMSVGMITTSMLVATRWQPARRGRALALACRKCDGNRSRRSRPLAKLSTHAVHLCLLGPHWRHRNDNDANPYANPHATRTHGPSDGACVNRSERVIPRRCSSAVCAGLGHFSSDSNGDHRCVVLDRPYGQSSSGAPFAIYKAL
jgi:MFS family permease